MSCHLSLVLLLTGLGTQGVLFGMEQSKLDASTERPETLLSKRAGALIMQKWQADDMCDSLTLAQEQTAEALRTLAFDMEALRGKVFRSKEERDSILHGIQEVVRKAQELVKDYQETRIEQGDDGLVENEADQ